MSPRTISSRSAMDGASSLPSTLCSWQFLSGFFLLLALYALLVLSVDHVQHDSSISYVVAAQGEGVYLSQPPSGRWVHAEEWQQFWHPAQLRSPVQVAHDLALNDIHPPLYFWLLHLWGLGIGVAVWSGPLLNVFFLLGTVLCVLGVCLRLGVGRSEAARGCLPLGDHLSSAGGSRPHSPVRSAGPCLWCSAMGYGPPVATPFPGLDRPVRWSVRSGPAHPLPLRVQYPCGFRAHRRRPAPRA